VNTPPVHIAVDVMGGDFGSSVTLPAVKAALSSHPLLRVGLFGRADTCDSLHLSSLKTFGDRVQWVECSDTVGMDEKPSSVLRHKQQSSLYQAIDCIKRGEAQACVSAGNTGALMATGHLLLKTFPGIDRPAVCAEMPTAQGSCLMLDLGANVDSSALQLSQFATMGSVMAKAIYGIAKPRVALLNIGEEAIKGNEQVKQAAQLLENNPHLHYIGYAEGGDIYEGKADVVVCDGFVGNAVLKASEGVARLIQTKIQQAYGKNFLSKLSAFFSGNVLRELKNEIDPSRYNGASFLGLQGIVVVSHGKTDVKGFCHAIDLAIQQVQQNIPQRIQSELNTVTH